MPPLAVVWRDRKRDLENRCLVTSLAVASSLVQRMLKGAIDFDKPSAGVHHAEASNKLLSDCGWRYRTLQTSKCEQSPVPQQIRTGSRRVAATASVCTTCHALVSKNSVKQMRFLMSSKAPTGLLRKRAMLTYPPSFDAPTGSLVASSTTAERRLVLWQSCVWGTTLFDSRAMHCKANGIGGSVVRVGYAKKIDYSCSALIG